MKKTILILAITLFSAGIWATPNITSRGSILPNGQNEAKILYNYFTFNGRYDSTGSLGPLLAGESRSGYEVFFDFCYGSSSTSEVEIIFPYINKSHTKQNGQQYSAAGAGDILLIGKSNAIDNKGFGVMSVLMGLQFPAGKSVFALQKDALPTGSGIYAVFTGLSIQENRKPFLLYGDILYFYGFGIKTASYGGFDISALNIIGESEVNYTPGNIIAYNIALEYPVTKDISALVELNGKIIFESKVEYSNSTSNAVLDLDAVGIPEYTFSSGNIIRITPGIKVYPSENAYIGVGASVTISGVNYYGGNTYFVSAGTIF